jgi:hypothetical protein
MPPIGHVGDGRGEQIGDEPFAVGQHQIGDLAGCGVIVLG